MSLHRRMVGGFIDTREHSAIVRRSAKKSSRKALETPENV